ncbi:hypothetical protein CsSME_00005907 [Camellia sinensis var. sinensis]
MDACSVAAFQEVVSAVWPPQTASPGTPTGHFAVYETPTLLIRTPTSRPSMVSRIRLTPFVQISREINNHNLDLGFPEFGSDRLRNLLEFFGVLTNENQI